MKALVLIPVLVIGCVGGFALMLKLSGLRMNLMDVLLAAAVPAAAAMISMLPILRTRETDPVSIVQRALIGTVLHILGTFAFAAILVAFHIETLHGPFVYWLLGSYWVSLIVLVWQLRLVMLRVTNTLPNHLPHNLPNTLKVQN